MRARNRRFCSSFDKFRKILSALVPFSDKCFSQWLICSKRRRRILRSVTGGGSCCFSRHSGCNRTTSTSSQQVRSKISDVAAFRENLCMVAEIVVVEPFGRPCFETGDSAASGHEVLDS